MNNYDKSSSGENIELYVFYDTSLAQMYFDEWLNYDNVEKIELNGRDNYLYLIGDSSAPCYTKNQLNKLSKQAIFDLWLNYDFGYNVDINDYKKLEYVDDLLGVTIKRHYDYLASIYSWHEIQNNISHDYYVTRGYSQGDARLIVKIDGLTQGYKKYIDNIFWDCPISIRAEINGVDYYEDSFLGDDYYEWDRDAIITRIMSWDDCSYYAKKWICDRLPDYPGYN